MPGADYAVPAQAWAIIEQGLRGSAARNGYPACAIDGAINRLAAVWASLEHRLDASFQAPNCDPQELVAAVREVETFHQQNLAALLTKLFEAYIMLEVAGMRAH